MKTRLTLLAAGVLPVAVSIASGQSTLQFSADSCSVREAAGSVSLLVQREGNLTSAATIDYATANGTATNGLKYTAVSGKLNFGVNETNKTIAVPILNNSYVDGTRNFRVDLSNPGGSAVLGPRATVLVSIIDNDLGLQFIWDTYNEPRTRARCSSGWCGAMTGACR